MRRKEKMANKLPSFHSAKTTHQAAFTGAGLFHIRSLCFSSKPLIKVSNVLTSQCYVKKVYSRSINGIAYLCRYSALFCGKLTFIFRCICRFMITDFTFFPDLVLPVRL